MTTNPKIVIAGVSALALAFVPAALALGASGWLGFTLTAHGFERALQQERRRAVYVAAPPEPPKAPPVLVILNHDPIIIELADLDGEDLTAYLRNRSHDRRCFQRLHWALMAPNDTQIVSGGEFVGDPYSGLEPGDRVEARVKIDNKDPRAVKLRLSVSSQTAC